MSLEKIDRIIDRILDDVKFNEDFTRCQCLQIGMRLATLDVLNSIDDNADAAASLTQTLDRIIACSKQAMSRHTCPLIEVCTRGF